MNLSFNILENISEHEAGLTAYRMDLAVKIDKALQARGMQKQELATRLGKNPSVITKWLSGTHNFTTDTLWEIERVLGIKLLNLAPETQTEKVYVYTATVNSAPVQKPVMPINGTFQISEQTHFFITSDSITTSERLVS